MATPRSTAPDVIAALDPVNAAMLRPLDLEDYDAALGAIADRNDVAGVDERARLGRVRAELERQAARLLAE